MATYSTITAMETYEELKMNIIYFDAEDIIVTSTGNEDEGVIVLPFLPAGG